MRASAARRAEIESGREPIAISAKYSIRTYVMRIPNRTALSAFQSGVAENHLVSLPLLKIQEVAS